MADEEKQEEQEQEQEQKGGMMKIVMLGVAVLVVIGIAVGATVFLLGGDDKAGADDAEQLDGEETADAPAAATKHGTPIYVALNPAFVVNFENQDKVSFLQVDIQIMTYDSSVEEAIKIHMPVVRNELLLLLGGKQYHEINTREGKRQLSQEAITAIQQVLKDAGAPSSVEALYFTSFVMQ